MDDSSDGRVGDYRSKGPVWISDKFLSENWTGLSPDLRISLHSRKLKSGCLKYRKRQNPDAILSSANTKIRTMYLVCCTVKRRNPNYFGFWTVWPVQISDIHLKSELEIAEPSAGFCYKLVSFGFQTFKSCWNLNNDEFGFGWNSKVLHCICRTKSCLIYNGLSKSIPASFWRSCLKSGLVQILDVHSKLGSLMNYVIQYRRGWGWVMLHQILQVKRVNKCYGRGGGSKIGQTALRNLRMAPKFGNQVMNRLPD